jgi:hypothetical protein
MRNSNFDFDAFISYRRLDGSVAARSLRNSLLSYKVPQDLRRQDGTEYPKLQVYRDEPYERATDDFFAKNIEPALHASKSLILVATPSILRPPQPDQENWVEREIHSFLSMMEPDTVDQRSIIVVRATGEIGGRLPDVLSAKFPRIQQLDFRDVSRFFNWWPPRRSRLRDVVVRIAAEIHGIETKNLPLLLREEERRQQKTLWLAVVLLSLIVVVISILAGLAWHQRGQAIARGNELKEQLITTVAATHPDTLLGALLLRELGEDQPPVGAFDAAFRVLDSPLPYAQTEAVSGSIERRPSFRDDGKQLLVFSDQEVLLADTTNGETIRRFSGSAIYDARLSPSGETVVTLDTTGTVRAHPSSGPSRVLGTIELDPDVDHWVKVTSLENIEFASNSATFYWPELGEHWNLDGSPNESVANDAKQSGAADYFAKITDSTGTARLVVEAGFDLIGRAEISVFDKATNEWEPKADIDFELNDSNTKRLDFKLALGPNGDHAFLVVTSVNPEFIDGDQHFTASYADGEFRCGFPSKTTSFEINSRPPTETTQRPLLPTFKLRNSVPPPGFASVSMECPSGL